jgi:hypothetical protein
MNPVLGDTRRLLYYPGAGSDWSPLRHFAACCETFLFADSAMERPRLLPRLAAALAGTDLAVASHEPAAETLLRELRGAPAEPPPAANPAGNNGDAPQLQGQGAEWGECLRLRHRTAAGDRAITLWYFKADGVWLYDRLFRQTATAPRYLCLRAAGCQRRPPAAGQRPDGQALWAALAHAISAPQPALEPAPPLPEFILAGGPHHGGCGLRNCQAAFGELYAPWLRLDLGRQTAPGANPGDRRFTIFRLATLPPLAAGPWTVQGQGRTLLIQPTPLTRADLQPGGEELLLLTPHELHRLWQTRQGQPRPFHRRPLGLPGLALAEFWLRPDADPDSRPDGILIPAAASLAGLAELAEFARDLGCRRLRALATMPLDEGGHLAAWLQAPADPAAAPVELCLHTRDAAAAFLLRESLAASSAFQGRIFHSPAAAWTASRLAAAARTASRAAAGSSTVTAPVKESAHCRNSGSGTAG